MTDSKGAGKLKDCFYVLAKDLEKAMSLTAQYGPDIWYDMRSHAEEVAYDGEKVYKVTVNVEEA